ncbi:MAG: hypothetical protein KAT46_03865 [Deltaproteobacteria bacterium]|nr:hypothetical protein [Deltaproteobacteria bacterium]
MAMNHKAFTSLLYLKYTHEKKYSVADDAKSLGIKPSTFYNYIEGAAYFPPDLISELYNLHKDLDFLNFFLDATDQMLTPRKKGSSGKDVTAELLDVHTAIGKLNEIFQKSYKDENLSEQECKDIILLINRSQKEIEELRTSINEQNN